MVFINISIIRNKFIFILETFLNNNKELFYKYSRCTNKYKNL